MSDMAIFRQSETEQNRIAENGRRLDTADEAAIGARNGTSTISRQRSLLLGDHEIRQCPYLMAVDGLDESEDGFGGGGHCGGIRVR